MSISEMPERVWAKSDRGFEGYAGTWLGESDGADMVHYIRVDKVIKLVEYHVTDDDDRTTLKNAIRGMQ